MQDNMARLYEAQRALTTGKRIQKPSDDPAAMTRIQSGKAVEGRLTQYQRNISTASGYLSEVESSLMGVSSLLLRVKELAMQGASAGAVDATSLHAIASEVQSLREQVLQEANSVWSGGGSSGKRHLFSGYRTDTPAFDEHGTYQGDNGVYRVQVGLEDWVTVHVQGDRIFQGTVDIFAVLREIGEALEAENPQGVGAQLDELEKGIVQVSTVMAEMGAHAGRLQTAESRCQDLLFSIRTFISREQDVDLVSSASKLALYQTALQASIQSTQLIFSSLQMF